jgi:Holliday junction DNA helicase RuvA
MIGKLTGKLESLDENRIVLDVNGVGYVVQASSRTLSRAGAPGSIATLLIETLVREDAIVLIGFADRLEKDAFNLLTTIQGVGARVALSILSTLTPQQLVDAILQGDKVMLSSADGVGPKLAARLLTELKDKIVQLGTTPFPGSKRAENLEAAMGGGLAGDAVSTLIHLGFRRDEAFATVTNALAQNKGIGFDDLIRQCLKDLAPMRRAS